MKQTFMFDSGQREPEAEHAPAPFTPKRRPRYYQTDAIDAIRSALEGTPLEDGVRSTLLVMATGTGKQQPVSEPVLTPSGWKAIGALRVGDFVIGSNGLPTEVTGVFPQGVRPVFRVELQDGTFARCGDEHLWTVCTKYDKNKGRPFRTITTREIGDRIGLAWQLPPLSPVAGADTELPVHPYELGVILGDGGLTNGSAVVTTDHWIGERLGWRKLREHEGGSQTAYWAPSKGVRAALRAMGMGGSRSENKGVPPEYMRASAAQRLELLRGLMDTDGYPGDSGGAEFSSTAPGLIAAVSELARSLGGIAYKPMRAAATYVYKGERKQGRPAWRLNIKLPAGTSPFSLPRKAAKYVAPTKYHPTRIIRRVVDEGVAEEQVCIMVAAPDHLYVTRDHILTHNTAVFSELIRTWPGRVLVVAHREELIAQACASLAEQTGERIGVEKAARFTAGERIVVGSIQSLRGERIERFPPDYFSLIVIDEAHRAPADSYVRLLAYFEPAKVLGVTATPDRADEKAMGAVFDTVAYVFDIEQGIDAGYLVPVRGREFQVDVDLSGIATVGGDLAQGELDDAMCGVVEGVVDQLLANAGSEQAITFTPGVRSAHLMADRANEARPGSAIAIDGSTDPLLRKQLVSGFKERRFQFLFNCAVATEGFDAPETSIVAIARPTKSRGLYAQMVGRGTRVLPGAVDHLHGEGASAARRGAIAASRKPHMTIYDFVGNAGKHALVTPSDVLGGNYSDEEIKEAKKRQQGCPDEDVRTSLKVARDELKALAKRLAEAKAKVSSRSREFDPFVALGMERGDEVSARFGSHPATDRQRELLTKFGLPKADVAKLDERQARRLLKAQYARMDAGKASLKQLARLSQFAPVSPDMSFATARKALDYISGECDWGRRFKVDGARLETILRGG